MKENYGIPMYIDEQYMILSGVKTLRGSVLKVIMIENVYISKYGNYATKTIKSKKIHLAALKKVGLSVSSSVIATIVIRT